MQSIVILSTFMLLVGSCSFPKKEIVEKDEVLYSMNPRPFWFNQLKPFAYKDDLGEIEYHGFFDHSPYINKVNNTMNVVPITPKDSKYYYDLDLVSGKHYRKHHLCSQKDVWERYTGVISSPRFVVGYIPRVFDQAGAPQKVVIFGDDPKLSENLGKTAHRVRLVGGMLEQTCDSPPCISGQNWVSGMLMVAVSLRDKKMENVFTIKDLKSKVNWDYFKAWIQNAKGRINRYGKDFPLYRIAGDINSAKAINYITSNKYLFTMNDLKQIQVTCFDLYELLWKSVGQQKGKPFRLNFLKLHREYNKEISMCFDVMRPSSINQDMERHWFFTYLQGLYRLQKLGHVYNCSTGSWNTAVLKKSKHTVRDFQSDFRGCSTLQLDQAFKSIPITLSRLRKNNQDYYRYIQYDYGIGGTHQKMYSWVYESAKDLKCIEKDVPKVRDEEIFPKDISWKDRDLSNSKNNDLIVR